MLQAVLKNEGKVVQFAAIEDKTTETEHICSALFPELWIYIYICTEFMKLLQPPGLF